MNTGKIIIEDYEIVCCHGVNPEEKVSPQRFLFSAELEEVFSSAAETDDIDNTVSYAAVCKLIKAFFSENCFNLLETLADRSARLILDRYPSLDAVSVTVKKPDAPMKGNFAWVGARAERRMTRVYLSLGSNVGDKSAALDYAIAALKDATNIRDVRESPRYVTEPYGGVADREFLNSAVELETCLFPQELLKLIGKIEGDFGRVREERWGNRTLDIDILLYGNEIISRDGLAIPHRDMSRRRFVLQPLNDIAPDAVHPLCGKSISDLLEELETSDDSRPPKRRYM